MSLCTAKSNELFLQPILSADGIFFKNKIRRNTVIQRTQRFELHLKSVKIDNLW